MQRYLLFAGDIYYPRGGAGDLCGQADTLDDAIKLRDSLKGSTPILPDYGHNIECYSTNGWWHIFDSGECRIVRNGWMTIVGDEPAVIEESE